MERRVLCERDVSASSHPSETHRASLEQFAGVSAALMEGIPLADVLLQEQLDDASWRASEIAWKCAIAADPTMLRELERKLAVAVDCLHRTVRPLEDDPRAWCGFQVALASSPAPGELLAAAALGPNDLARLHRSWQRRIEATPEVRAAVEAARSRAVAAVPTVQVGPVRLRPFPWTAPPSASTEGQPGAASSQAVPGPYAAGRSVLGLDAGEYAVARRTADAPANSPPNASPLQSGAFAPMGATPGPRSTSVRHTMLDELASTRPSRTLPFVERSAGPTSPPRPPAVHPKSGATVAMSAFEPREAPPVLPFRAPPRMTVEQYAELHVALHARPVPTSEAANAILARFGLDGWGAFRDVALGFRSRFTVDVALRERWLSKVTELRAVTGAQQAGAAR